MKSKTKWHDYFDEREMIVSSFRYFLGRMTISTCAFAESLAKAWPVIEKGTRDIIKRELEKEFELDDIARLKKDQYQPLGHDCDREAWEKVRKAWNNESDA